MTPTRVDAAFMWAGDVVAEAIVWCARFCIRAATLFSAGALAGVFAGGAYVAFNLITKATQ